MPTTPEPSSAPTDAKALLRRFHDEHARTLDHLLATRGIPAADRPDLIQEVFIAAYRVLVTSPVPIDNPRAWLRLVAVRLAGKYHRRRAFVERVAVDVDELGALMNDPEQSAAEREILAALFEELDELSQCIVLGHKGEGVPLIEVARDHGLTEGRAEYVYRKAVATMEAALRRRKLAEGKRRGVLLPITLFGLFDAARAEADASATVQALQHAWESIEREIEALETLDALDALDRSPVGNAKAGMPDGGAPPTILDAPPSAPAKARLPRWAFLALAWLVGADCGFLFCWFLVKDRIVTPPPPRAPVAVEHAPSPVTTVLVTAPTKVLPAPAPVPVLSNAVPRTSAAARGGASAKPIQRERPYAKIVQARAALAVGDALAAVRALEAYGPPAADDEFAAEWRRLMELTCRSADMSAEPACTGR